MSNQLSYFVQVPKMDVKAGYDVDSQKAKDIKSALANSWHSTSVLENSELEKMQMFTLLDVSPHPPTWDYWF